MSKDEQGHRLRWWITSFAAIALSVVGAHALSGKRSGEDSHAPELHARAALLALSSEPAKSGSATEALLEWRASRKDQRIKLSGAVASREDRVIVLGMVKANFPDFQLDDRVRVVEGPENDDVWLSGVSYALKQLKRLSTGSVTISGRDVSVGGVAHSSDDYQSLRAVAQTELPDELQLAELEVVPPAADPFVFAAEREGNRLVFTGHMPGDDARKSVSDLASSLFTDHEILDKTELASGAPEEWLAAVTSGIKGLSRLPKGKFTVSELDVRFSGVAPNSATASAVATNVREALPAKYRWSDDVVTSSAAAPPAAGEVKNAAAAVPEVTGSIPTPFSWRAERRPGVLTLSGDVPSETARNQLLAAVRVGYPGSAVEDNMVVSSGAPSRWLDAAALAVEQLGRLEEGYVFMTDRSLSIVGRLNPGEDVGAFEQSFAEALPIGFRGSHALAIQRPAEIEKAERCQNMLDGVLKTHDISFHGGSAKVLSESKPVLVELARIAGTCPNSVIEVAAKPDADADPIQRSLVRKRAQSVLDYLADHGVHNTRLGMRASSGMAEAGGDAAPEEMARLRLELNVRVN